LPPRPPAPTSRPPSTSRAPHSRCAASGPRSPISTRSPPTPIGSARWSIATSPRPSSARRSASSTTRSSCSTPSSPTSRRHSRPPPAPRLQTTPLSAMNRSIYDEPLRLIEHIVTTDQPYTKIVTADYTMADRTVATVWGLDHSDADAWETTHWTDDRGAAGILASTALYLRYRSVAFNFNRGRANAISRSLLCHDFSESDV